MDIPSLTIDGVRHGLLSREYSAVELAAEALRFAQAENPKTKKPVKATGLGAVSLDLPQDVDPRHAMVDWMADKSNPFFASWLMLGVLIGPP